MERLCERKCHIGVGVSEIKEIPSIDGVIKKITSSYGENPWKKLTNNSTFNIEGREETFILEDFPYRIDRGEKVIIYSSDFVSEHPKETIIVKGIQVLDGGREIKYQSAESGFFFHER